MKARPTPLDTRPKRSATGAAGFGGGGFVPHLKQANMPSARGMFCQKIQRHERWSTYQPSSDAEMLSESSRLSAYRATPYAHRRGGMPRRMKLSVRGMKNPDAAPPRNWKASRTGRLGENGSSRDTTA